MAHDRSRAMIEAAARVIPGGVSSAHRRVEPALAFTRAEGACIVGADGNPYIDYHAASGPAMLGHCHPEVNRRVAETIERIDLVGSGPGELEIALAEKIVHHVPSAERVFFCNSGTEATYHAIRLARAVTGRRKLVKFQGCYHGWHDAVLMNVASPADQVGEKDPLSAGMSPAVVEDTLVLRYNDVDQVRETIEREEKEIAAVILEPIAHNIGAVLPRAGFLRKVRRLTAERGIVLIFDEVVTGFRHGLGGYQEVAGVTPDLTTFGKAIANGFPLAALCGRADLMDRYGPDGDVFFAGTFNAHRGSVAAGLATLGILERSGSYEHLFGLGERMRSGLRHIVEERDIEATVAGFGSIFVLCFLTGPIDSYDDLLRNDADRDVRCRREMIARGVYLLPVPLKRSHISLAHTAEDIDRTLDAAEAALATIA
ncbi:MAG TPA: aspartate aminotransferase family protein [Thermomicrobiales bacterium]|nr:aspartate aminotransferase family protein [Thermomicrobiales bacterium]